MTRGFGCPHCVGVAGSCCQCDGARIVTADVAARNLVWLWEWAQCACAACASLATRRRSTIPAPEPTATPEPEPEPIRPPPDGTFAGHFRRRCVFVSCGKRIGADSQFGAYCSRECLDRGNSLRLRRIAQNLK